MTEKDRPRIDLPNLTLIENDDIRVAVQAAYRSIDGTRAIDSASQALSTLTSNFWSDEALCKFLSGWRSTHGTTLFVSGLLVRMLREIASAADESSHYSVEAARQIAEIIAEDAGVSDTPHSELFETFADTVAKSERWRLPGYRVASCERLRAYVKRQRLEAPIEQAILTTMASECWNVGEYTFFARKAPNWAVKFLGVETASAEVALRYITVHAGQAEQEHFLAALRAWQLWCAASGTRPDTQKLRLSFEHFLRLVTEAFVELCAVLSN